MPPATHFCRRHCRIKWVWYTPVNMLHIQGPVNTRNSPDAELNNVWTFDKHQLSIGSMSRVSPMFSGGPRVVVSTAAFHARVRGSVPGLGGLKETKMFLPHPSVKVSIVGSLRDREVACSASDRQGSNFESCVWRTVSSQSSHHPQEVFLAQFSLYVHKGGLKPDSFHFLVMFSNGSGVIALIVFSGLHCKLFSPIPIHDTLESSWFSMPLAATLTLLLS